MAEYVIFTDAGGDVPAELWTKYGLGSVPMSYLLSGETGIFDPGDPEREACCAKFYDALRRRADVSTTQITPFLFE